MSMLNQQVKVENDSFLKQNLFFYDAASQRTCALKNTLLFGKIMPLV